MPLRPRGPWWRLAPVCPARQGPRLRSAPRWCSGERDTPTRQRSSLRSSLHRGALLALARHYGTHEYTSSNHTACEHSRARVNAWLPRASVRFTAEVSLGACVFYVIPCRCGTSSHYGFVSSAPFGRGPAASVFRLGSGAWALPRWSLLCVAALLVCSLLLRCPGGSFLSPPPRRCVAGRLASLPPPPLLLAPPRLCLTHTQAVLGGLAAGRPPAPAWRRMARGGQPPLAP